MNLSMAKVEEKIELENQENGEPQDDSRDTLLSPGDSPDFKWYVAKTKTGQEKKASKSLRESIINCGLTEYFSEIFIPEESVTSHLGGKKKTIKKKFFPGYILIKMIMNDETWHLVKNTDNITNLVGSTPDGPRPISDEEAAQMTNQSIGKWRKLKTIIDLGEGDQVKVVEGPFATFIGTVESVGDRGKVRVNVSIFGRLTPVELEFSQVEKIA